MYYRRQELLTLCEYMDSLSASSTKLKKNDCHDIVKILLNVASYNITLTPILKIRVITKLPNSEQSHNGKVKTHKYTDRQNQSTTGKL